MPLNPQAALIADPGRAALLFPPMPCRQCAGSPGKIQRYEKVQCTECKGSGEAGTDSGGPCPACWNPRRADLGGDGPEAKKSSGMRMEPRTIPCPNCNGQSTKRRVPDGRPQTLNEGKPGDWVVIGVEFPALPIGDVTDPKYVSASAELVSCMIVRRDPQRTLIIARVMQSPEYSQAHGLKYGDLLQLGPNHILVHSSCTHEEFEKAKQGGLFTFAPVQAIPPVPGRDFFTRGGDKCKVWTIRNENSAQFALGALANGANIEWNLDGTERQGRRDFDLVQLAQVVNA